MAASVCRLLSSRNVVAVSRRATNVRFSPKHFVRWQSAETPRRGLSASRVVVLGLTASGVAVGSGLVYANYDPIFREKVNDYVPGFAGAADYVADRWISVVDYFKPKPTEQQKKDEPVVVGSKLPKSTKPLSKPDTPSSMSKSQEKPPKDTSSTGQSPSSPPKESTPQKSEVKKKETQQSKKEDTRSVQKKKEPDQSATTKKTVSPTTKEKTPQQSTSRGSPPPVTSQTPKPSASPKPTAKDKSAPASTPPTATTQGEPDKHVDASATESEASPSKPAEPKASPTTTSPPEKATKVSTSEKVEPKQLKEEPKQAEVKEVDATVEGVVASVKEATAKAAQEIMSEQIKEHQAAQTSDEHFQWLKDSAQVDAKLQEAYEKFTSVSEKVLDLQSTLTQAITNYHKRLTDVSRSSTDDVSSIQTVAGEVVESEEAVEAAKKKLDASQQEHKEVAEHLKSLMDEATSLGLKTKVKELKDTISSLVSDILSGAMAIAEVESNSKVLKEYQQEVEKSEEKLKGELGTALPKADSQQEAVILMLQKRVEILKERLGKVESEASQKVVAALEKQKQSLEQLAEEKTKWKLQKLEYEHQMDLEKQIDEVGREYEHKLRNQLRVQTDAHTQHLAEALHTQAEQLGSKWVSELEFKLTQQETYYQTELAKAVARLRGIESMVDTVANAGERTYQQQSLRSACDSLNTALERANSNPDTIDRYTFSDEVSSLREAARGDPFILSTLDSIPPEASSKTAQGIQSEAALKERFSKVKRVCKRVALVPETGGGLGRYALSYVQSLLTLSAWDITTRRSYDDGDLSKMDTFDLLHHAESSLHHGDLENAIRCLGCLQGEPRRVANDWLKDARLYLETRQAVNLIESYMAATSLSIIQK